VKAEAAKVEAKVTEATGQVASFVKGRLEQAQKQIGQLETEAQKALQTLVSRSRESGREVLQKLNVNELRQRANPTVRKLEQQATQVGGEVRQRLSGLRSRMVTVVGGVASQSQVDALNRELDRLSRKLDTLVAKKPEAQQPQQQQ
jgi:polyhydroxyalkanoate synthesis regulator phasin